MNSFCFSNIRKNKLIFLIVLLLVSLVLVYMPHALAETYEHHNYESSVKYVINNNKSVTNFRKLLKKLRLFLHKIFRLPQILSNIVDLANIRLVLLNIRFFIVPILDLFSFLCFYFHGSKYKHSMKHSDLLPLMAV